MNMAAPAAFFIRLEPSATAFHASTHIRPAGARTSDSITAAGKSCAAAPSALIAKAGKRSDAGLSWTVPDIPLTGTEPAPKSRPRKSAP